MSNRASPPYRRVIAAGVTGFALAWSLGAAASSQNTESAVQKPISSMSMASDSMGNKAPGNAVAPDAVAGIVTGAALVDKLRQGGLILWMRHGERDNRAGDESDAQAAAHDCAKQSQLTAKGRTQAQTVGAGIRALNLPIAEAHPARLCRTEATARLLNVGPVATDSRLDEASTWHDRGGDAAYEKAVFNILSTQPPAGQDVVEVTSKLTTPNPEPAVLATLGPAEIAVFKPGSNGQPQLLARIGWKAWHRLEKAAR